MFSMALSFTLASPLGVSTPEGKTRTILVTGATGNVD
jgi:hypothetical protein